MPSSKQRLEVWNGTRKRTSGGLTRDMLVKNKRGKIVSLKKSTQASDKNNLGDFLREAGTKVSKDKMLYKKGEKIKAEKIKAAPKVKKSAEPGKVAAAPKPKKKAVPKPKPAPKKAQPKPAPKPKKKKAAPKKKSKPKINPVTKQPYAKKSSRLSPRLRFTPTTLPAANEETNQRINP